MRVRKSTRVLLLGAGSLLVAAGAGAIGASNTIDTDGNNRALSGSDALKGLANDILTQLPFGHDNLVTTVDATHPARQPGAGTVASGTAFNSPGDGTYYTGGGQSVGDGDGAANFQQLLVGTASLKNSIYGFTATGSAGWINADGASSNGNNTGSAAAGKELPIQGTTETLVIGLDGLTVLGNTLETASSPNGLVVKNAALTVHHYVPSDARFFPGAGSGGSATATSVVTSNGATPPVFSTVNSNQWILPNVTFVSTDVGGKLAVTGALGGALGVQNNQIFSIATVVDAHTITTVQLPFVTVPANTAGTFTNTENFVPSVNFTVYSSRTFVVNDADTTFPITNWGATGGTYTFNNSLDVLRLLYGGLHHDGPKNTATDPELGTFDAGSDVRRSLADSWGTLFQHAPATPAAKLNHAWRRPDPAGVTNAFIALVNFGVRGLGSFPSTTLATKTNPFANTGDANGLNANTHLPAGFPWNSTVKSPAGPGDFADDDPIRRPALKGPNPSTTSSTAVDLDQVAENDGTLGLVLVAWPPDALTGAQPTTDTAYPRLSCTTGKYDLLTLGSGLTINTTNLPPEGGPFSGQVFIPYFLDTSVTPNVKHYSCLQKSTNQPPFGAPTPRDNRAWNLVVRNDSNGQVYKDNNARFLLHAGFYRAHTTLSNTLVTPGTPSSGLVLAKQLTSDAQEGALVAAEPQSLAFSARGVDVANPSVAALSLSGETSLGTAGQFDPTAASYPTDQNIKNLVLPGATPVYPLARRLYAATLVGFTENPPWSHDGILKATGVDPGAGPFTFDGTKHAFVPPVFTFSGGVVVPDAGSTDLGPNTAVRGLQGQEAQIARLYQNSDHIGALIKFWGFVPLPSAAEGFAPNGVFALDYPEDAATSALPLNGAGDNSGRYYAAGALPFNFVTAPTLTTNFVKAFPSASNEDATVVSPPDSITPYSASLSSPPFPYSGSNEPATLPWP